jgi:pyridinium-3,5-biscarboxylic acid mononucleotide synthase
VALLTGGTADAAVAEECRLTAELMGCYCFRVQDVSTDGLHRIIQNLPGATGGLGRREPGRWID